MKKTVLFSVITVVLFTSVGFAEIVRGIDIDFVTIGDPGNPGDTRDFWAEPYGCGAVDYEYQIGKYEITNTQWNSFVLAVGAPTGSTSPYWPPFTNSNVPANCISWYEATQFCNYLTSGDKSQGVYQFSGNNTNPGTFLGIDRNAALSTYGKIYALPTEDEWYKAAYYKPDGSGYSSCANGQDSIGSFDLNVMGVSA